MSTSAPGPRRRDRALAARGATVSVAALAGVLGGIGLPSGGRPAFAALIVGAVAAAASTAAVVLARGGHLRRVVAYLAPIAEATRRLRGNHGRELLGLLLLVVRYRGVASGRGLVRA